MKIISYDAIKALEYAKTWANKRNPNYYDFSLIGGDCTNFASQCLFSGTGIFNYTLTFGWYYISAVNRSPSFTGVEQFYNFLINNYDGVGNKSGPFGINVDLDKIAVGDFIQLKRNNKPYHHTLFVSGFINNEPLVSAHSFDAFNKPLSSFSFDELRCIHILGARKI